MPYHKFVWKMLSKAPCLFLFLLLPFASLAQSGSELAKRNGFKDIVLGMPVDSVAGSKFKKDILEKNEFPAALYEVDGPAYKNIGEVKVKRLELKAYKGLVYQIDVITHKDTRLMKGMERLYGKPKYILPTDTYNWTADSLSLTFKDHSKREIKLTYRSYPILKMMRVDKGKKIDDIADDF
ncbi:MAG TPA: hypothetical protein PKW06_13095 [Cyclobacteriaceae bacterium]|nr:hypothetical protein [Cyclobacteriaceae bacterium]